MIEQFTYTWWIFIGRYAVRIAKPWKYPVYAWWPLMKVYRLQKMA